MFIWQIRFGGRPTLIVRDKASVRKVVAKYNKEDKARDFVEVQNTTTEMRFDNTWMVIIATRYKVETL